MAKKKKKKISRKKASKKVATKKITKKKASKKQAQKSSKKLSKSKAHGRSDEKSDYDFLSWPIPREVLYRPDRYNYVKAVSKPEGCVFCQAYTDGPSFESLTVYKTELSAIVLNKFPYNPGHVLVIPRRHEGDLTALSGEEFTDLNANLRLALEAVQKQYKPHGVNLGMNLGHQAGAGIPEHLHYHIIPRWRGDSNFFPLLSGAKVLPETLEQAYERLVPFFED